MGNLYIIARIDSILGRNRCTNMEPRSSSFLAGLASVVRIAFLSTILRIRFQTLESLGKWKGDAGNIGLATQQAAQLVVAYIFSVARNPL